MIWSIGVWKRGRKFKRRNGFFNLDAPMAKFDKYEQLPVGEEDDFNNHDWKAEIENMDKVQQFNLWISPLNWVVDLKTKAKKKWI